MWFRNRQSAKWHLARSTGFASCNTTRARRDHDSSVDPPAADRCKICQYALNNHTE